MFCIFSERRGACARARAVRRQFLDKSLVSFAKDNPQLQILVSARPNKDPIARGWYVQDRSKTLSLRNLSSLQVMEQLQTLRNSRPLSFRKSAKVFRTSASVQGEWELGMLLPRPHRTLRG